MNNSKRYLTSPLDKDTRKAVSELSQEFKNMSKSKDYTNYQFKIKEEPSSLEEKVIDFYLYQDKSVSEIALELNITASKVLFILDANGVI